METILKDFTQRACMFMGRKEKKKFPDARVQCPGKTAGNSFKRYLHLISMSCFCIT